LGFIDGLFLFSIEISTINVSTDYMKLIDSTAQTSWKFLAIIAALAVFAVGGALLLHYSGIKTETPEQPGLPAEKQNEVSPLPTPKEIPPTELQEQSQTQPSPSPLPAWPTSLTLLSPRLGEAWLQTVAYTISWCCGTGNVDIFLYRWHWDTAVFDTGKDEEDPVLVIGENVSSKEGVERENGEYIWQVPKNIEPGPYYIRIADSVSSYSRNEQFRIIPPMTKLERLAPVSGPVGSTIILHGEGFMPSGNTVNFGTGAIPNVRAPNWHTLPSFILPNELMPGCFYEDPACAASPQPVTPGEYTVSVTNDFGITRTLTFTVTEQ